MTVMNATRADHVVSRSESCSSHPWRLSTGLAHLTLATRSEKTALFEQTLKLRATGAGERPCEFVLKLDAATSCTSPR